MFKLLATGAYVWDDDTSTTQTDDVPPIFHHDTGTYISQQGAPRNLLYKDKQH